MCIRLRSLTVYFPFVTKLIRYCQVSFSKHVNVLFLKQFPILKGDLLLQSKQFSLKPQTKMFCSCFQWQGFHHTKNIGDVSWAIFSTYIIIFLFTLSCHCRQKVWQWPKMCTLDRTLKIHGIFFCVTEKKNLSTLCHFNLLWSLFIERQNVLVVTFSDLSKQKQKKHLEHWQSMYLASKTLNWKKD